METAAGRGVRLSLLTVGLAAVLASHLQGCQSSDSDGSGNAAGGALPSSGGQTGGTNSGGGASAVGGIGGAATVGTATGGAPVGGAPAGGTPTGGAPAGGAPAGGAPVGGAASGGATGSGATNGGGASATGGAGQGNSGGAVVATGGASAEGGEAGDAGAWAGGGPQADKYVVAMVQSSKADAAQLTLEDVVDLVSSAVAQAGGLDFIQTGQTVVLKPNLVTAYTDHYRQAPADQTVNGISTDWRVVKAVADLVREKVGSTGKILVMEGSTMPTGQAFSMLGYTSTNMSAVDEFVAIEGSSCTDRTTTALVQKAGLSGTEYWVNRRYAEADVVISIPTMKTHLAAGITGAVKNLGVGTTPMGQFSDPDGGVSYDCTRGQAAGPHSIDHSSPEAMGAFIRDYYSIRPADFAVMDGLQGIQHGPAPAFEAKPEDAGYQDYASSRMNMRLILAGRNAVAVDTVEALVMKCDPRKVPHLTLLEADGLGTADISKIDVVGKQIAEVAQPFACLLTDICPGM
jgi:uncharacterized protein (DUF362 family)